VNLLVSHAAGNLTGVSSQSRSVVTPRKKRRKVSSTRRRASLPREALITSTHHDRTDAQRIGFRTIEFSEQPSQRLVRGISMLLRLRT